MSQHCTEPHLFPTLAACLWLGMRPGASVPATGHHVTTWRPRRGDGPSSEWPRISTQPSLTGQALASAQLLEASCSLSAAQQQEQPGLAGPCGRKSTHHECRSDNKREVTAWESSTNQNAQMHKTTRKTRAMRCKSCTSRTQPLERRTEGEQANNKHFSLFLSRTNQTRKTQRLRD